MKRRARGLQTNVKFLKLGRARGRQVIAARWGAQGRGGRGAGALSSFICLVVAGDGCGEGSDPHDPKHN